MKKVVFIRAPIAFLFNLLFSLWHQIVLVHHTSSRWHCLYHNTICRKIINRPFHPNCLLSCGIVNTFLRYYLPTVDTIHVILRHYPSASSLYFSGFFSVSVHDINQAILIHLAHSFRHHIPENSFIFTCKCLRTYVGVNLRSTLMYRLYVRLIHLQFTLLFKLICNFSMEQNLELGKSLPRN
jgi:hypothetical protein